MSAICDNLTRVWETNFPQYRFIDMGNLIADSDQWDEMMNELRQDPYLVAYFNFTEPKSQRILDDMICAGLVAKPQSYVMINKTNLLNWTQSANMLSLKNYDELRIQLIKFLELPTHTVECPICLERRSNRIMCAECGESVCRPCSNGLSSHPGIQQGSRYIDCPFCRGPLSIFIPMAFHDYQQILLYNWNLNGHYSDDEEDDFISSSLSQLRQLREANREPPALPVPEPIAMTINLEPNAVLQLTEHRTVDQFPQVSFNVDNSTEPPTIRLLISHGGIQLIDQVLNFNNNDSQLLFNALFNHVVIPDQTVLHIPSNHTDLSVRVNAHTGSSDEPQPTRQMAFNPTDLGGIGPRHRRLRPGSNQMQIDLETTQEQLRGYQRETHRLREENITLQTDSLRNLLDIHRVDEFPEREFPVHQRIEENSPSSILPRHDPTRETILRQHRQLTNLQQELDRSIRTNISLNESREREMATNPAVELREICTQQHIRMITAERQRDGYLMDLNDRLIELRSSQEMYTGLVQDTARITRERDAAIEQANIYRDAIRFASGAGLVGTRVQYEFIDNGERRGAPS